MKTGLNALLIAFVIFVAVPHANAKTFEKRTITKTMLRDKIKGAWAGQTIGVCFGSYTEFKYLGTYIPDSVKIKWHEGYAAELMDNLPGLFDDIYMDITFVDVIENAGIDAPVDLFATAFANAEYPLWHANQAARYNILNGVEKSGHWLNNPHADDIDYQIEADFAGIMCPGMPNSASAISDRIGHIMCYGDGWYGGVYIGAMYSLAFVSDDIEYIVNNALKTIPQQSTFYKCISDVISWHKQFPDDWKKTWHEIQNKYANEKGCPEGVFSPLDIDAKLNAAYVVLGLLYGNGDFTQTMEISTRAGQDSDCNPASAGGVLGTMLGYDKIPEYWKKGLNGAHDKKFKYTQYSLNDLYNVSFRHALNMIKLNNGKIREKNVRILVQEPETVRFEQCFEGLKLVKREGCGKVFEDSLSFSFEGAGFVLRGVALKKDESKPDDTTRANLYIDGKFIEEASFPTSFHSRRHDLFWNYTLPEGKHKVDIKILTPQSNVKLSAWDYVVYSKE